MIEHPPSERHLDGYYTLANGVLEGTQIQAQELHSISIMLNTKEADSHSFQEPINKLRSISNIMLYST